MDAERLEQGLELFESGYPDLEYRVDGRGALGPDPGLPVVEGWFAGGAPVERSRSSSRSRPKPARLHTPSAPGRG